MAQFTKRIVGANTYHIPGRDKTEVIDHARMQRMVDAANRMIEKGYRIPAPFAHYDGKEVPAPVRTSGSDFIDAKTGREIGWRADLNAGFWKKFEVREDGLYGVLDAYGSRDDETSPAGKIAKTVKETSILTIPKYKDHTGEEFDDALLHVALVTAPVEGGQPNFEVPDSTEYATAMAISMAYQPNDDKSGRDKYDKGDKYDKYDKQDKDKSSRYDQDQSNGQDPMVSGVTVEDLVQVMAEMGIILPEDTHEGNLIERLVLVARQRAADMKGGDLSDQGDTRTPPQGSQTRPPSVAMSQEQNTADNDQALSPEVDKRLKGLLAMSTESLKTDLVTKAETLKPFLKAEFYTENIENAINKLAMSVENIQEDGSLAKPRVEILIDTLASAINVDAFKAQPEKAPAAMATKEVFMAQMPEGFTAVDNPTPQGDPSSIQELSDEQMSAIISSAT